MTIILFGDRHAGDGPGADVAWMLWDAWAERLPVAIIVPATASADAAAARDQALAVAAALGAAILVVLEDQEQDLGWLAHLLITRRVSACD